MKKPAEEMSMYIRENGFMHEHVVVDAVLERRPERDAHITIEDVACVARLFLDEVIFVARLKLEESSLRYLVCVVNKSTWSLMQI